MVDCQWSVSRIQRGSENVFHANAIKLGVGGALRYSRIFGVSKVEVCFVGKRQRREVVCIYLYGYCVFDVNVSMCYLDAFGQIIKIHLHQIKYKFPLNVIEDDRNKNVILSKTKFDEQD